MELDKTYDTLKRILLAWKSLQWTAVPRESSFEGYLRFRLFLKPEDNPILQHGTDRAITDLLIAWDLATESDIQGLSQRSHEEAARRLVSYREDLYSQQFEQWSKKFSKFRSMRNVWRGNWMWDVQDILIAIIDGITTGYPAMIRQTDDLRSYMHNSHTGHLRFSMLKYETPRKIVLKTIAKELIKYRLVETIPLSYPMTYEGLTLSGLPEDVSALIGSFISGIPGYLPQQLSHLRNHYEYLQH